MWEGNEEREITRCVIYMYEVIKENRLYINVKIYRTHTQKQMSTGYIAERQSACLHQRGSRFNYLWYYPRLY